MFLIRLLQGFGRHEARIHGVRFLLLIESFLPAILMNAARTGAEGILSNAVSSYVLLLGVELLLMGQTLFPPEFASLLPDSGQASRDANTCSLNDLGKEDVSDPARKIALSEREQQVLRYLAAGYSNKLISRELAISEATVKVHVKCLLRKMQVVNRTQAAIQAFDQ